MGRERTSLEPIDGSLDFISPIGQRKYVELQNVYARGGHLRRRPALVNFGPTSTPGTDGIGRLVVEFKHHDNPPTETEYPDSDEQLESTPVGDVTGNACIDDIAGSHDDATTYIDMAGGDDDWYTFSNFGTLSTIDSLTVYVRGRGSGIYGTCPIYVNTSVSGSGAGWVMNAGFPDGVWTTKSSTITTNPMTGVPLTVAAVNAFYWWLNPNRNVDITQFYLVAEGQAAATRERSKIYISNTQFLRLEEDLSAFTDIDDTLASTAGVDQVWDTCEFANKIWFVNDVDDFFNYPDAGELLDQNATALAARTIAPYGDRLFAGNIYEGAARLRTRIRWSIAGNGDDFAAAGSGNFDLDGVPGEIVKLVTRSEKASTYTGILVAFKDTSIYHIWATGDSDDPFDYRLMDGSVGAVGTAAVDNYVSDRGEVHAFVGKRNGELNVFEWDGNQCVSIGDAIKDDMNDNANYGSLDKTSVRFDPSTSLLWVAMPRSSETYPSTIYTYDILRKTWKEHLYEESIPCLGQYKIASVPTLVVGKSDNLLTKSDTSTTVDTGTDQSAIIEWAPIFLGDGVSRVKLYRVAIWYLQRDAAAFTASVSNDGGVSWPETDSVSLLGTAAGTLSVAYADVMAEGYSIALKLECATDADFEIVRIIPEWSYSGTK